MKLSLKAKILFLVFSVFFGLITFEILLRILTPKPENLAKLEESTLFLHENKPNAEFRYGGGEFDNEVRLNSYGFRDDEFRREKSEGVLRIAVLGDSFSEALQVDLVDTWQKVMARKLSADLKVEVESYNFGVSGYGTDQNWLTLREKVWQFNPDLVVLAFTPNDLGDTYKNGLVTVENGEVKLNSPKDRSGGNKLGELLRETYTYHLIVRAASAGDFTKRVVDKFRTSALGFPKEERFFLSDAQLANGPFEIVASQINPPKEVEDAWQIIKALLTDMKNQTGENSSKLLITISIPGIQANEEDWVQARDQYKLNPDTSSSDQINKVLKKTAGDLGIPFYDPRNDALSWIEENGELHFPVDGHFNENGHNFMGENVARYIIESGLLEE